MSPFAVAFSAPHPVFAPHPVVEVAPHPVSVCTGCFAAAAASANRPHASVGATPATPADPAKHDDFEGWGILVLGFGLWAVIEMCVRFTDG